MNLFEYIIDVPNWPTDGVTYKDISPLLANATAFDHALEKMQCDLLPDYWIGIESRGFIFASAMAQKFGGGILMVRKKGKLPPPVISKTYTLEYGSDTLTMKEGEGKGVIVDDVLATGGTLSATHELCKKAGYDVIATTVLLELGFLNARNKLAAEHPIYSALNIE
ncbi:MAG: adenine phosphoribosyltransferase [Gammaproteobacteria bacterium]